jgi:hypothetical protein
MAVDTVRRELRAVFAATRLRLDEENTFTLVRLPTAAYPDLLLLLGSLRDLRFQATVREPAEVTLILPADLWDGIGAGYSGATVGTPWRLITLDITIPLDVYGYLEVIAGLCAEQGASLLVASGYSTDHLLIQAEYYPAVRDRLQAFIDECRLAG